MPTRLARLAICRALSCALLSASLVSCDDAAPMASAGTQMSAMTPDAALPDTALLDAAPSDAAPSDAAPSDASLPDAALPDAALPDAYLPDAYLPDASPPPPTGLGARLPAGPAPETFDCRALPYAPPELPPARAHRPRCLVTEGCADLLVVGHRGVGGDFGYIAPENSLAALRAALALGLDGVELDVRHTADEGLVLMHDGDLSRTTGRAARVGDLTLAEVTATPLLPPPMARAHDPAADFSCERVPTLDEALALTRGRLFVDLDMKTSRVDLVLAALERAGVVDEVFISVSDPALALEARRLNPAARVQVRPDTAEELAAVVASFAALADPAAARPPEVVEVPEHLLSALAPLITAAGGRPFADAWSADLRAQATGDGAAYLGRFEEGAQVLQVECPAAALRGLGRW